MLALGFLSIGSLAVIFLLRFELALLRDHRYNRPARRVLLLSLNANK
jgi:hypothetical protein